MIVEVTEHGEIIIDGGKASYRLQAFFDAVSLAINENRAPSYTVATVPDATKNEAMVIYVSDETGGATLAFSDATNWRRVQDRAIIS